MSILETVKNGILEAESKVKTGANNLGDHIENHKGKYLGGALAMFLIGALAAPVTLFFLGMVALHTVLTVALCAALLAVGSLIAGVAKSNQPGIRTNQEVTSIFDKSKVKQKDKENSKDYREGYYQEDTKKKTANKRI